MDDFLRARRERIAGALKLRDELLLVGAGSPLPLPENSDQTYPFFAHAEYAYLAGNECIGGIVAFDPKAPVDGRWVNFVPEVTEDERIWEGRQPTEGRFRSEFPNWLALRRGRPVAMLGCPEPGISFDEGLRARVRNALTHARRGKDGHELALLGRASAATATGFAAAAEAIRPGATERQVQIELETGFFRGGADRTGFSTIVGAGPHSSVLHFSPTSRIIAQGDFVLIDAGAQVGRYTADVTRTYVAGGAPSPFQRDLHGAVLSAQRQAIARCRSGREWKDIHLACAVDLTEGLISMGILRGKAQSLVEQEAHALFFPHGLGHMVGLGVRDASGLQPGRKPDPRPSLRTLRMDLPLEQHYVVTVEPGLYFIPPLLDDPRRRTRFADCVDWARVDQFKHVGGVRIEDDVLVTAGDPEVLTAGIPKEV